MTIYNFDLLKQLSELSGISSFEQNVAHCIEEYSAPLCHHVYYDGLGSVMAYKEGSPEFPTMMLACHMDEVGFIVNHIDEQGFLHLQAVGSWWSHVLLGQCFQVTTRAKKVYKGIIGSPATHGLDPKIKARTLGLDQIYLDMGVSCKQDILDLGMDIGDMVTPIAIFHQMNHPDYYCGKALDNRVGVAIGIWILEQLGMEQHATLTVASTVQEEPGLRGARTSTHCIHPDIAFAIDTTLAGDTPLNKVPVQLGHGVVLTLIDSNALAHRGLLVYVEQAAKECGIAIQYGCFKAGGTDSGNIHKSFDGIMNMTISIPIRYMHTSYAIIHRKDVEDCVTLLKYIATHLDIPAFHQLQAAVLGAGYQDIVVKEKGDIPCGE